MFGRFCLVASIAISFRAAGAAESGVVVNAEADGLVYVSWPVTADEKGEVTFDMDVTHPLIESIGVGGRTIATELNPAVLLTIGTRDLKNRAGWVAFFDNPRSRDHETLATVLGKRAVEVMHAGTRTTVKVAEVSAGSFHGDARFTFYRNSPLILCEIVLSTKEDGRAIVYDMGMTSAAPSWSSTAWHDTAGTFQQTMMDSNQIATSVAVRGRAIVAESKDGSMAVFPTPHRYFYPLDEAFNLKFVWHGRKYREQISDYGIGIRQAIEGDKRFVPWFNAPPSTEQHLGMFCLISSENGQRTLNAVAEYTRNDRYKALPGYQTFTSHYHVEHTKEFLAKQKEQNTTGIPHGLEVPGMVKTFKARGVNVVHLAEFHNGQTPKLPPEQRLPQLKAMHDECERLSDETLLILPGEEANVHLGGHWLSFFPKPVYWVLNRADGEPFSEQVDGFGTVYHVGNTDDVLRLMEIENGLMWTAHARIKSSIGFPDQYKTRDFFLSDRFQGAAWKAMPADLSRPTLGWRVLDLLDDMSNWGLKKHVHGEADLFRMEPDFETYAHMNINYLQLDGLPKFQTGWKPVIDSLRSGNFFTTTGEILISEFTVDGKKSGGTLNAQDDEKSTLEAQLEWTFPLSFAEVVSGDGNRTYRQYIDLTDTESFGTRKLQLPLSLKGRSWVRFEVWDIAANGAFTQPIWIEK